MMSKLVDCVMNEGVMSKYNANYVEGWRWDACLLKVFSCMAITCKLLTCLRMCAKLLGLYAMLANTRRSS